MQRVLNNLFQYLWNIFRPTIECLLIYTTNSWIPKLTFYEMQAVYDQLTRPTSISIPTVRSIFTIKIPIQFTQSCLASLISPI